MNGTMVRFKNESCDEMLFLGVSKHGHDVIWNVVDITMFLPTVLGNLLILISIVRFRRLRLKIHILIGFLAANDFLVGATLLPLETIGDSWGYIHKKYYCLTKISVFAMTLGGSLMGLLLISVERFSAVVFPLRHAHFTKRKLLVTITCGWLYVLFWTFSPLYGCNTWNVETTECNASILWGGWCKFGMNVNFLLGLCLTSILYGCVVSIAVRKVKEHGRQTGTTTNLFKSREMSKTVTMATVLGLFALFWFPYALMTLVVMITSTCVPTFYYIRRWCLLLGLFHCSINWIIYGLRNKDFKDAFKTILMGFKFRRCFKERRRRRVACSTVGLRLPINGTSIKTNDEIIR